MQAVILAAGMGKRLKELTQNNTKCMVKVNGKTLIERTLKILDRKNLSKIIIVVGYKARELMAYIDGLNISTEIIFVNNPIYSQTNNIYSLSLADNYLILEDTLLFESDLIFSEDIVDKLIEDERDTLAVVDKFESWMDGTCMVLDEHDNIVDFISGKLIDFTNTDTYYKTVNIYKFSKHFSANTYVPFLEAYRKAMGQNEYYESVIKLIAMLGTNELRAMRLHGQTWYEIDDVQDLDIAETLFPCTVEEQYAQMITRYGGYWRYPKIMDFCYLVNPYFPSERMIQEIMANIDALIRNYPSGMRVNSMLASRNFGIGQEHIVIGNGAAELIKVLMETVDLGKVGMIKPSFEEYPNRYTAEMSVFFNPENDNFSYTAVDLISYFEKHEIDSLILINPDNPSGNYIPYSGIMNLVNWAKSRKINIVIDESFADFADTNEANSLIAEDILALYDRLYVVKSISKSYGVPGLRLGILTSSDTGAIARLKRYVPIWNINSIAEFYMQIYEKYEKDYQISLKKIIQSRKQMIELLEKVPYLRAMPTQANYICCEVLHGMKSDELAQKLLEKGILIKCLTSKISNGKEYIRVAVRTEKENEQLVEALITIQGGYQDNSRWKEIWNGRQVDDNKLTQAEADEYMLYKELKRLDGFDVQVEDQDAYYRSFYNAMLEMYETNLKSVESIYEVGCGSGANLVIYRNRGKQVGGVDYSDSLVRAAQKFMPECDIATDEAINITADKMYDVVISDSVFAYFPNEEYGRKVLKKMYDKAKSQIILLEIFDKDLENACNEYRRASVEDYDKKYAGLNKIFYPRQMFIDFAEKYGCKIKFTEVKNEYYWNSRYMYNCYIYKDNCGKDE